MKMIIVKIPISPEGMKLKQLFLEYLKSQIEQKIHPTNERAEISELAHIFTFVTEKSNSSVGFQRLPVALGFKNTSYNGPISLFSSKET